MRRGSISNVADKGKQNTQAEQQREKRILKNEENLRSILDNMKQHEA